MDDVARFSGEDERRRFYGEDHHRPAPRREIEFGNRWTMTTDPGAIYTLRWVEDTHEIYVIRRPRTEAEEEQAEAPFDWESVEDTAVDDDDDDDDEWLDTIPFARDYTITDGFPVTGRFAPPPGFPGTVPLGPPGGSEAPRQPQLNPVSHAVQNMHFGTQVLGWAESRGAVEAALNGWEAQMPAENSLQWVRDRLGAAAGQEAPPPRGRGRRRRSLRPAPRTPPAGRSP